MRQSLREAMGEHLRENIGIYFLVAGMFVAGTGAGAFSVRLLNENQIRELNEVFFNFLDFLTGQQQINQSMIFQRSLAHNGLFVLALWLCGNFFFGFIFALGLIFYRGFSIGFTVGFLAEQNALRGVLFSLGAILPQNLLYVPSTIVAGVFTVTLSLMLLRRRFSRRPFPYGAVLFQYTVAMLAAGLGLALGSIVETVITPVFMRAVVSLL